MGSNDDEGIIPILNQLKAFELKWRAKKKQYEALELSLNLANISNKELKDECERLKSCLNTSIVKIKEFEIKCKDVEAALNVTKTEKKNFESKCIALESSLNQSDLKNKELETKCEAAESSLKAANTRMMDYDHKLGDLQASLTLSKIQCETFRSKCQNLESTLNKAESKNRELEQKNEVLESSLSTANAKMKELESKWIEAEIFLGQSNDKNRLLETNCQALESSLRTANAESQELERKHNNIESHLNAANTRNEELEIKLKSVKSSLSTANAGFKELDLKCMSLESLLRSADTKRKELETKLDESNKEIKKFQLQKNKLFISALQKVQNKLSTNPLYIMIDNVKRNLQNLDEVIKTPALNSQDLVDIIAIGESDNDDDESTLSFVSEQPSIEEDFNEALYSQSEVTRNNQNSASFVNIACVDNSIKLLIRNEQSHTLNETNERDPKSVFTNLSESMPTTSTPCINRSPWKNLDENCDMNMRYETSDNSNGSDISLNVYVDDTETSTKNVKTQIEPSLSINNVSSFAAEGKDIENNSNSELGSIPQKMNEILDSNNSSKQNVQNEVMDTECNEKCPTLDEQVGEVISNFIRKSNNKLKVLHPIVLLTRWEYEKDDVTATISNKTKTSHVPAPSKSKSKHFTLKNSPENIET